MQLDLKKPTQKLQPIVSSKCTRMQLPLLAYVWLTWLTAEAGYIPTWAAVCIYALFGVIAAITIAYNSRTVEIDIFESLR